MLTIYRFPALYQLAMRIGYGRDYAARYALIADRIGRPSEVLEVCCGGLGLYRYLHDRGLLRSYVGLDLEPAMLRLAARRGANVRAFDVRDGLELPGADTVIIQASLYQFHDIADTLLSRLWAAARRLLVISEPVRNLAHSRYGLASWLARMLNRTTDGRIHTFRYSEATLLELYRRSAVPIAHVARTPAGREVVVTSLKAP